LPRTSPTAAEVVWRPPGGTSVFVYLEVFVAGGRKEEGGREGEMDRAGRTADTFEGVLHVVCHFGCCLRCALWFWFGVDG